MLKALVRLLRLLDSERTDSQRAPDLGQMNGDECRQCVGHLLGQQLLPSAILSCPTLVPAVKLTMHSVPVRRENAPCCPSGLVAEKLGKVHKAAQMEKICLFFPAQSLTFGPVVSEKSVPVSARCRLFSIEKIWSHIHPFVAPARSDISLFSSCLAKKSRMACAPCGSKNSFMPMTSLLCRRLDSNFVEMWFI